MKKRVLCLVLTLVMMLGMAPMASAYKIMGINNNLVGETAVPIVCGYYQATVEDINDYDNYDRTFLDPHEAWDDYITTQEPNNWFDCWLEADVPWRSGQVQAGAIHQTMGCGKPNNLTYNMDRCQDIISIWWAGMDSYIAEVQDKGVQVDGQHAQFTEEEAQWVLWWSVQELTKEFSYGDEQLMAQLFGPYAEYTFQEWKDFLNGMSDDELELFTKWWNDAMTTAYECAGAGWAYEVIRVPFEEWKASKAPNNQPVQVPSAVQPVATPEPDEPDGIAYASTQTVDLDGTPVTFQCYAIKDENGNPVNYVKLRDLALYFNGTTKQFQVGHNGLSVTITKRQAYTPNGSELTTPFTGDRPYSVNDCITFFLGGDGARHLDSIILTDDNGGGYTYYKLRDLGKEIGFNVGWSADRGMFIETNKAYNPND